MKQIHCHFVKKTRKDHVCYACGGIIPKGTEYVHYRNALTGKRVYFHPNSRDCNGFTITAGAEIQPGSLIFTKDGKAYLVEKEPVSHTTDYVNLKKDKPCFQ